MVRGDTYTISGHRFNGLSQAQSFGDEFQASTNYPLVRMTNSGTGHVFYAKTHDHSTMGVATGNSLVSTNFDVPAGMEDRAEHAHGRRERDSVRPSDDHGQLAG